MKHLKSKVAVITGAGSGIGRSLAIQLAQEGCIVALNDVNEDYLAEVAELIQGEGGEASIHVADIAQREAVKQFSEEVIERHGRIDLLINNAGVSLAREDVQDTSLDYWDWIMKVNFWGTLHCIHFFHSYLQQQSEAHIVNVSSVYCLMGVARRAAYCASKFAVRGLTESMVHELREGGIKVSLVLPGGVATRITSHSKGHKDAKVQEALSQLHNRTARNSAESAARTIIRGIKRNRKRIFIGADAKILDRLVRLSPQFFGRIINLGIKRAEAKAVQKINRSN
ncbi:MAG: SDR family NAD(P)-dependent oxidoreductase [Bacteroidota bacterium]